MAATDMILARAGGLDALVAAIERWQGAAALASYLSSRRAVP
jgi:hypothetical protein